MALHMRINIEGKAFDKVVQVVISSSILVTLNSLISINFICNLNERYVFLGFWKYMF